MKGPLNGVKVVDLSHAMTGPWAAALLSALGADVIKIESPEGDLTRQVLPTQKGLSVMYCLANFNKYRVTLDLKEQSNRDKVLGLLRHTDVYLQNMRPGIIERLGLGYGTVSRMNPSIIFCSISAWGDEGPMANLTGRDNTANAFSGLNSINGAPGGEGEFFRQIAHMDQIVSNYAVLGILLSLIWRKKTGQGRNISLSMLGPAVCIQFNRMVEYLATKIVPTSLGSACPMTAPHEAFQCEDGAYIAVGVVQPRQWPALCKALEVENLLNDVRFASNVGRIQHKEELRQILSDIFKSRPLRWWEIKLTEAGVPHGNFMGGFSNIIHHRQVWENRFVREIEMPGQRSMYIGDVPWRFNNTLADWTPIPDVTVSVEEVFNRFKDVESTKKGEAATLNMDVQLGQIVEESVTGTLKGVKVVDITQGICGPYASMLLAEAEAEVVKAEHSDRDCAKAFFPPGAGEESIIYKALNWNKRKLNVDLKTEHGRKILLHLLDDANVFLEDLGPGEAEKIGLGYTEVKRANPKVIYCSITPFGTEGPFANRPGAELVIQAMSGYWTTLGQIGEPPERLGADIGSMTTAIFALQGILAAYYHLLATGEGQRVNVSMLGSLLHMRSMMFAYHSNPDVWEGREIKACTVRRRFGEKTKDGRITYSLARRTQEQFDRLLIELGIPEMAADPRFAEAGRHVVGAGKYTEEVKPIWEQAFQRKTTKEIIDIIWRYGCEAARVNNYRELFADDQMKALSLFRYIDDRSGNKIPVLGFPWRLRRV